MTDFNKIITDILDANKGNISANIPKNINILLSGGGLGSFYHSGIIKLVDGYCRDNGININNIYCVSGGAMMGVLYLNGVDVNMFSKIYNEIKNDPEKKSQYLVDTLKSYLEIYLDDDCHIKCTDKLHIFVYEWKSRRNFERKIISKFDSKDDLINAVIASCTISYITSKNSHHLYNGKCYVDGIDIDMSLVYNDVEKDLEKQIEKDTNVDANWGDLIIDVTYVDYKMKYKLNFIDENIDELILKGINDVESFLFENNTDNKSIRLLHPNNPYVGQTLSYKIYEWIFDYFWKG